MKAIEIPFENGCYNLTYARCMYILAHDGLFTLDGRVYGVLTFDEPSNEVCWVCEMDCLCTPVISDLCAQFDLLTDKTCMIDIVENLYPNKHIRTLAQPPQKGGTVVPPSNFQNSMT